MNQTLKETLTKLILETGSDQVSLLPCALYRDHNSPYTLGLTPFQILYVRLPPLCLILRQNYWLYLMTKDFFPPYKF